MAALGWRRLDDVDARSHDVDYVGRDTGHNDGGVGNTDSDLLGCYPLSAGRRLVATERTAVSSDS